MSTLITCHENADFDAFASLIGASLIYPDAILLFPGTQENNLQRYIDEVAREHYSIISPKELKNSQELIESIDRVVIVDTRQSSRLLHIQEVLELKKAKIIVWDHHPPSEDDIEADEEHIEQIGAVSSLISLELLQKDNPYKNISSIEATLLSLGIHIDTGSFTYVSTTEKDFKAASLLWKVGIDAQQIRLYMRTELTPSHIKALNELLETAEYHEIVDQKIVIASTSSDDYIHDFALLAPRFMEMQPCKVFFALAQMAEKIQVLARSTEANLNVGAVCSAIGGGGHEFAASASVKNMPISEVKDLLIKEIYLQLNLHKLASTLMTTPVVRVYENTSMGEASTIMIRYGLKAVPVFKINTRTCIGWITQEQASRGAQLNHLTSESSVALYMQREFKVISLKAHLQDIMDIIIGEKQRLLPVVNSPEVDLTQEELLQFPTVGVITRTDLIRLFSDENTILPMPTKSKKAKKRNLAKPIFDRVGEECVEILKLAGKIAEEMSFQVSAVGGFVRDIVMDKKLRHWSELDIDFVVEGDGILFAKKLSKALNGKVREHETFMTATIFFKNKSGIECKLDIATARLEYYEYPAALPTVEVSSLKMDLYRRDFTINAMAVRLNPQIYGVLVDYFNGQPDIRYKKIRMLHTLSFIEDPTRIIRAIRFEQRYSFNIDIQCEKLMQNAVSLQLVDKLSGVRLTAELELILKEESTFKYFMRLEEFNVLHSIHPQLKLEVNKENILKDLLRRLEWYTKLYLEEKIDALAIVIIALLRNAKLSEFEEIINRFAFKEKRAKHLLTLRSHIIEVFHTLERWAKNKGKVSRLRHILLSMPMEVILYCMARTQNEDLKIALTQYILKWQHEKADITGRDLESLQIPHGKIYKELLNVALDAKLDNEFLTRDEQLQLVKELYFSESQVQ